MFLVMTLIVKDEEDILRENIEYHLHAGVDYFLVIDNASTDATADILDEYKNKDVLDYKIEYSPYSQSKWATKLAQQAFNELGASWIINNDADEFWWCPSKDLKQEFNKYSNSIKKIKAIRHNMLPTASDNDNRAFYYRMTLRWQRSVNALGNPLPNKTAGRGSSNIVVHPGSHDISYPLNAVASTSNFEIFHYPYRSYDQLVNKVVNIGRGYAQNPQRDSKTGNQPGLVMRTLYKEYLEDPNFLHNIYKNQGVLDENLIEMDNQLVNDLRMRDALLSVPSLAKY